MSAVAELTEQQQEAVRELAGVLGVFHAAIVACKEAGLQPADAFRAAGIEIPAMAAPLVNQMLG